MKQNTTGTLYELLHLYPARWHDNEKNLSQNRFDYLLPTLVIVCGFLKKPRKKPIHCQMEFVCTTQKSGEMEVMWWRGCRVNFQSIRMLAPFNELKIHLLTSTILQLIVIVSNGLVLSSAFADEMPTDDAKRCWLISNCIDAPIQ